MIPLSYNLRNLRVRWKTTLMTAGGFTVAVAALVLLLAFVSGIERACANSGEPCNVIVLGQGDTDEVLSRMDVGQVAQVEGTEGVVRDEHGRPLASREHFLVVFYSGDGRSDFRFLQVRGVLPVALVVHPRVRLTEGRLFRPGQSEVVVGKGVRRDTGLGVGDTLLMGRKRWRVTGVLEADGAGFEGEVWCDLPELLDQFRRVGRYSSVVLRAADPAAAAALAERLAQSRHLGVEAVTEMEYYRRQADATRLVQNAAWVIACFVSVGAACGVMNTMFAAIAQRSKDVALLRILGFRPGHILVSFLVEAVLIAVIGGALGLALGAASNGLTQTAGLGGDSPSPGARQIDFTFRVDGMVVAVAAAFTISLGLAGGLLPALSAMRVKPLEGLR